MAIASNVFFKARAVKGKDTAGSPTSSFTRCDDSRIEISILYENYNKLRTKTNKYRQPYSAAGGLDQDGTTNAMEYRNILSMGGTPQDFANSVVAPANDGTNTGEGEGSGGWAAVQMRNTSTGALEGNLLLLGALMGLLAQARRKGR